MGCLDGIHCYLLTVGQIQRFVSGCKAAAEITHNKQRLVARGRDGPRAKSYSAGGDVNSSAGGNDRAAPEREKRNVIRLLSTAQRPAGNIYRKTVEILQLDVLLVQVSAGRAGINSAEVDNRIGRLDIG